MKTLAISLLALLAALPASAQIDPVTTAPVNLVLNNYDSVPVGPFGGLEGSAYVARVGDPSAAWFNPAGLARGETAQISGSAGVYQFTTVSPDALPNQGGSLQQLPNYVGFTFTPRRGYTVGTALINTISWTQETDSQLISTTAAGQQQRFAYSADSGFEHRVAAFSVGYYGGGHWRYGGGFAISMMDLRLVAEASQRIAMATGLQSLLVSGRTGASAVQLRLQGGAQYDVNNWRFGLALRTPGATFIKSSNIALDSHVDGGRASVGASLFDSDAETAYHLPWEFQGGVAYATPRAALEVDLQAYTSIAPYSLVATGEPLAVYTDNGSGVPPAVQLLPFSGLTSASDGVLNVSIGGNVQPFANRRLRIHGSVGNNQSPVAAADQIFNRIDLVSSTIGVSGTFGKFVFAAGVNFKRGSQQDVTLRNLLNGQVVHTDVQLSTTGFIYSLAYQF
jgi:hypothetical protein